MSGPEIQVTVPDLGDVDDVEVIEVLAAVGDTVEAEQGLITLESDKASMEVPSTHGGVVTALHVEVGDTVVTGATIATLATGEASGTAPEAPPASEKPSTADTQPVSEVTVAPEPAPVPPATAPAPTPVADHWQTLPDGATPDHTAELVVIGSGPGGYTAAFRAADLGLDVVLVERYPSLGGVCLNVGCIPSKALLHVAKVVDDAAAMADHGVSFGAPSFDLDKLRAFKDDVVGKLTGGLASMAKQRKVRVVQGTGSFAGPHALTVDTPGGQETVAFRNAVIAAGSQATKIPIFPYDDPRLMDSTDALELGGTEGRMLVIGGGIIGLEMATVYHALGSRITVVELLDGLMPGADRDVVRPFQKYVSKRYENIFLSTKVTGITSENAGLRVTFEGKNAPESDVFDRVLVAVGRRPNGGAIGCEHAGVAVDERGFIAVDKQMRTNVPHIFAIGDLVGQPMLAHKAVHEGKVAAEVAAGHKSAFDARVIPSVAYTDPEVAWVGLTETDAKANGTRYEKANIPWAASGRARSLGRHEGMTKLLFDPDTKRVLGAGIVGVAAGDLIAEVALAIEMGADAEDIGLTIHPHPTLSETIAFSAEAFEGTLTDMYLPKKKRSR